MHAAGRGRAALGAAFALKHVGDAKGLGFTKMVPFWCFLGAFLVLFFFGEKRVFYFSAKIEILHIRY